MWAHMREGGQVGVGAGRDGGLAPHNEEGHAAQRARCHARHPRLGRAPGAAGAAGAGHSCSSMQAETLPRRRLTKPAVEARCCMHYLTSVLHPSDFSCCTVYWLACKTNIGRRHDCMQKGPRPTGSKQAQGTTQQQRVRAHAPVDAPGLGHASDGALASRFERVVARCAAPYNSVQVQRQAHRVHVLRQQACAAAQARASG